MTQTVIAVSPESSARGKTLIDVSAICDWAHSPKAGRSIEFVEENSRIVKLELVCDDEEPVRLVEIVGK